MSTLVNAPFAVRLHDVRGRRTAVVEWRQAGRRVRKFFSNREAARAFAAARNLERAATGSLFDALTPGEKAELVSVWHAARQAGASLRDLLDHWTRTRAPSTVTLGDAITALLAAKAAANRRPAYLDNLAVYVRAFARGREALPLSAVTSADVEEYLAAARTPTSRATRLGRLATLFSYAVRRGWLAASPCARVERVSLERHAPRILAVPDCARLLAHVRAMAPDALPTLVLALFAGVRPTELSRVTWADVDLPRALLTIAAAASKVRQRRLVDLAPACVAWLRLGGDLPLSPHRWRAVRESACAALALAWPADVLRHTAASMLLARDQDAARVALQLGHSPAVLLTHYRELVPRETAKTFFALLPQVPVK